MKDQFIWEGLFVKESLFCQGKLLGLQRSNLSKGYPTEDQRREQVSSAVRQDIKACPTQLRGWSEKILFTCQITVADCERHLSQGRESINLTERGLKDLFAKSEIYEEGSAELEG